MHHRRIKPNEIPSVHALLAANGWRHRIGSIDEFQALLAASQVAHVAVVEHEPVAFVRGITDGLSNGYLSMVVVAPEHRGKGVGRSLVEHAIGSNPNVTWVLRAGRIGAPEFFAKLGFRQSTVAMERRRV